MAHAAYNDPNYKALRQKILADQPNCAICGRPGADTLDHIQPLELGGTNEEHNLRPAHRSCNSRLGANLVNAKNKARIDARNRAMGFLTETTTTPIPTVASLQKGKRDCDLGVSADFLSVSGRIEPRLESLAECHTSVGPLVAEWSLRHLMPLMDWQIRAVNGMLGLKDDAFWYREALISCARQQGKSVLLKALAGFFVTEWAAKTGRPQSVMLVANKLDRSSAIFRELAPILEGFGGKPFWSYGREQILMPDGSSIRVAAATSTQHGASNDLVLLDEIWSISPAVIFDALRPTMIARPSPLMAMFSTAGDESSTAMLKLREQAINAIDAGRTSKLYFAEWSPPPGVRWQDREWWPWANPALGTTVTWDALEAAAETPDKNAFLRAHLNLWISSANSWLAPGRWDECQTTALMPDGGILAIDSSLDESRYVGVRAYRRDDKKIQVAPAFIVESEDELWAKVEELMANRDLQLAVSPSLEIHTPKTWKPRTRTVGYGELLKWTGLVRAMINEGKVEHGGELALAEHVSRAVLVKQSGNVVLSSQKSPGPIELARCLVWATALASAAPSKARVAIGRS